MSLSPPSTFLCVAGSCTVVDKNADTIGAIHCLFFIALLFEILQGIGSHLHGIKLSYSKAIMLFLSFLSNLKVRGEIQMIPESAYKSSASKN